MKAISITPVGLTADGKQIVDALVVSNSTPETLPTTGANIDGMNANQVFAPMSIIYVTANVATKVYLANESGSFVGQ